MKQVWTRNNKTMLNVAKYTFARTNALCVYSLTTTSEFGALLPSVYCLFFYSMQLSITLLWMASLYHN